MEVQSVGDLDIISTLPKDITTKILNLLPTRDAVRTSILSRKWRYSWLRVSAISFDHKIFKGIFYSKEIIKHKLANAIFHVLLLHTSPLLKFSLSIIDVEMDSELDQIILYLSKSDTLQELNLENNSAKVYKLPCSFFSLQGLWYLRVRNCHFTTLLAFTGFSRLTCLTLINVKISSQVLKHLLANCPLLVALYLFGGMPKMTGEKDLTFVELFECLSSIQAFGLSNYYLKYFASGGMPHELPNSSLQVKYLFLSVSFMDRDALSCSLYLIKSFPNLIRLSITSNIRPISTDFLDHQDFSDFKLAHLQDLRLNTIKHLPIAMQVLKLIMARAPVLKIAVLELDTNVSVDEELEIYKELPIQCASPSALLYVHRRKTSS